jgi:hypothetical protein
LTGTVQRLDGKPALGARVLVYGVPPTVVNTAGDTVRAGLDPVRVDITGKFSVSLPSDATTGNPPADTARVWVDTGSVFSADVRTRRDLVNITSAGTVTITLGATPKPDSDLIWRTRAGATILLQPVTNYTLTGTTLTVPSVAVGDAITIRYNYGYAGTDAAVAISDQAVISDSFDRANSTTSLGSTDTGQTWSVPLDYLGAQPVFGITANTAYPVTNTTNLSGLAKWVNGTASTLLTFPTGVLTGDTVRVTRKGDTISVYIQPGSTGAFNLQGTVTDAVNHGTRVGLNARATWTTARWDDFRVYRS